MREEDDDERLARQRGCKVLHILDENNEGLKVVQYEELIFGTYFMKFFEDPAAQLRSLKQFPHRKDDVLVCTYPKSGSHWMVNLLTMLLTPSSAKLTKSIDIPIIEVTSHDLFNKRPSPRVLHSHLRLERLPTAHVTLGGKIILTVRNPKDVAVSMYYHLKKDSFFKSKLSWNGFFAHFTKGNVLMGSYFEYLKSWDHEIHTNKDLNILVVYFENLVKRPLTEVRRIQTFLGLQLNDSRLQEVIDRCSMNNLKDDVVSRRTRTSMLDENKQQIIYRKGEIGDWLNHFTVAQSEAMDKLIEEKLSDTMFKFDFYPALLKHKL